jgi:prephenate dehydrogenase
VTVLSVTEHDEMIAYLSQLTHCIAVTLMTANMNDGLEKYTGDSFRDLTRIAKINDVMWSELFLINKTALLHQLTLFERELNHLRCMLEEDDVEGLKSMMRYSTARRALFDKKTD